MAEFLLNLVDVNENINYSLIITVIVSYLYFLWFVICIWVFTDGQRRYKTVIPSVLFTIFVFIFGPPALIFYVMVRPEHTLEEDYYINLALSGEKELKPIYFDGNKGFDISINMSVQPKENSNDKHKMFMDVSWMPQDAKREVIMRDDNRVGKIEGKSKLRQIFDQFKKQISIIIERLKSTINDVGRTKQKKGDKKENEKIREKDDNKDTSKVKQKKEDKDKLKKKRRKKKKKKRKKKK